MNIQHEFISSFILPAIFPKSFWVEFEKSDLRNKKYNPFLSFNRALDDVFLCRDLFSPNFFFRQKYGSVVHVARHLMIDCEAPMWNIAIEKKIPKSWKKLASSLDKFLCCCHKLGFKFIFKFRNFRKNCIF